MEYRIEKDTMGEVHVPIDRYWGAQDTAQFREFQKSGQRKCRRDDRGICCVEKAAALA